ncbi:MAG: IPTL-CTERM sorting domain-containing protein [Betaproteobacteria bacterium]|nr:MAG: IPTL-CTERM sorting domain-containing protein [Betaproteobacteria bacterium]
MVKNRAGVGRFVSFAALSCAALLLPAAGVQAQQFIYGNSASSPSSQFLYKIDKTTGAVVKSCQMNKGNGRGMVVVNNIAYYTTASNNNVFKADMGTCADMGVAFTVAGATSLSTIAFDGTNFWVGDYSGTNQAFYYSPTGTLLATVHLTSCTGFCDGLEWFNGKLISNEGDASNPGHYDIYALTGGAPTTANFINTTFSATGIAFDGTNFYVSDIFNQKLQVYNGTTGAFINTITITGMNASANVLEDLSADYAIVIGGGGGPVDLTVPTMSEWALILMSVLLGLLGLGMVARRARR